MAKCKVVEYTPLRDAKEVAHDIIVQDRYVFTIEEFNKNYFNGSRTMWKQENLKMQNGFETVDPHMNEYRMLSERFSPFITEITKKIRDDLANHLNSALTYLAAHGLSARMIALRLNMDPSVFSRTSSKKDGTFRFAVPIEKIPELAHDYFGCSVSEFLLGSNDAIPIHASRDIQLLVDAFNKVRDKKLRAEIFEYINKLAFEDKENSVKFPLTKDEEINKRAFERIWQAGYDVNSNILTIGYLNGSAESKNRLQRVIESKKIALYLNTFLFLCYQLEISPDVLLVKDYSNQNVLVRTNPFAGQMDIWDFRCQAIPLTCEPESIWRPINENERFILSKYLELRQESQNKLLAMLIAKTIA